MRSAVATVKASQPFTLAGCSASRLYTAPVGDDYAVIEHPAYRYDPLLIGKLDDDGCVNMYTVPRIEEGQFEGKGLIKVPANEELFIAIQDGLPNNSLCDIRRIASFEKGKQYELVLVRGKGICSFNIYEDKLIPPIGNSAKEIKDNYFKSLKDSIIQTQRVRSRFTKACKAITK